jgi:hypothetical protein
MVDDQAFNSAFIKVRSSLLDGNAMSKPRADFFASLGSLKLTEDTLVHAGYPQLKKYATLCSG